MPKNACMFQKSRTFDEFLIKFYDVNLIIIFDIVQQKQQYFYNKFINN